jgi:hypothetical protein
MLKIELNEKWFERKVSDPEHPDVNAKISRIYASKMRLKEDLSKIGNVSSIDDLEKKLEKISNIEFFKGHPYINHEKDLDNQKIDRIYIQNGTENPVCLGRIVY